MKKKLFPIIALAIMIAFGACSNEELFEQTNPETNIGDGRTLSITASMPEEPTTYVGLEQKDDKTIALTWEVGDELKLAFVQGDNNANSIAKVKSISDDKKKATFNIKIPDEFETGFDELGNETVIHHKTKFENRDNEIIGAYAWAEGVNGYRMYCIMTRKEIETSWSMAKAKQSKFREDFKQEASKRTVIRRLVKMIFNTSISTTSEQEALIHSYNRTTEDEFDNSNERKYQTLEGVKEVVEASVCEKKVENPFKETKVEEQVVEETKQEEFVDYDLPMDNDTGEIKDIKTFDYEI